MATPGAVRRAVAGEEPIEDTRDLRLDRLNRGEACVVRLRLTAVRPDRHDPTPYFLDARIACRAPADRYHLTVATDFGTTPPQSARLTALPSRSAATPPVTLVERRTPLEGNLPVRADPSSDTIVFWIVTEGSAEVPEHLAAAVRVRAAGPSDGGDDLDTMRLPVAKAMVAAKLADALRTARSPALRTLGKLFATHDLPSKIALLGDLTDPEPDLRWVEAAAADIAVCEQTVRGFPLMKFEALSPRDPVNAALLVFHPSAPGNLVGLALLAAFEGQVDESIEGSERYWRRLVKAAALVARRKAPGLLEEALRQIPVRGDPGRRLMHEMLVRWVANRPVGRPPPRDVPFEMLLGTIAGGPTQAALEAAAAILAAHGFLGVSTQID